MGEQLVVAVRFHDRFHGTALGAPEWPPSPARLFQALVAGAARGEGLPARAAGALGWLERLEPPIIAAPRAELGAEVALFVPNNDRDAGDVEDIRVRKLMRPRLLEPDAQLLYAWRLPTEREHVAAIIEVAQELYQLGRGIDMAWATAEVLDDAALEMRLSKHPGSVHEPNPAGRGHELACPIPGSLASLEQRHRATRLTAGAKGVTLFTNAPKPRFLRMSYASARRIALYELRQLADPAKRHAWPLRRVVALVERVRDAAAARLAEALPDDAATIQAALVGRAEGSTQRVGAQDRIRILALPSIGHRHVDPAIRRIAVEIPSSSPLAAEDVEWVFSGLELPAERLVLARVDDPEPLAHFAIDAPSRASRRWRSITPVAVPEHAQRRRIEPTRRWEERKGAAERSDEERHAADAIGTALRHAGVRSHLVRARVQREPFEPRGARVEAFAEGTRFPKERLWHVELELEEPIDGPLVLGDGRFLGLGTMAPLRAGGRANGVYALEATAPFRGDAAVLARAARRALMARAARVRGEVEGRLPPFFSGHESGAPMRTDRSGHVAVHVVRGRGLILVIAPHRLDHRSAEAGERRYLRDLADAVRDFRELRAGRAGRHSLELGRLGLHDPLLARGRVWISVQPYTVTRHGKRGTASEMLREDVLAECRRRKFPLPEVDVLSVRGVPGRGVQGMVRLTFPRAVAGPIALGKTRYLGGGLFVLGAGHAPERASS